MTPGVVTITTDAPVAVATGFALETPFRLVIDFPAVVDGKLVAPGVGSVAGLRLAMFAPGTARLVIDLSAPLEIVSARSVAGGLVIKLQRVSDVTFAANVARRRQRLMVAAAPGGFDLPADMFAARSPPAAATPPPASPQPMPPTESPDLPVAPADAAPDAGTIATPAAQRPSRRGVKPRAGAARPLVVIDAGHGGKDVGAISINGGYEKDVTLAIARATARALEKSGRVRVKLTRADDRFIPLGGRVAIAREARADLFISIHADSAPNAEARGASVYTVSAVASDAIAERLAARENKADIIGGVNLGVDAPGVANIMIDLARRATSNVSVAFAEELQDELASKIGFRGEFHHFAGFRVLKAPDVPSVLLETGYVTNDEDAGVLFSPAGRQRIAEGIARAIERHLVGG